MNRINKIITECINEAVAKKEFLKNTVFVAYGTDKYDINKFTNVDVNNIFSLTRNKPSGGLWASPIDSEFGWGQFCNSEGFRLKTLANHFIFKVAPNANIYVINDINDLKTISTRKNYFGILSIDFNYLLKNNFDGIFVTHQAASTLRQVADIDGLDSWDVESICVFNPKIIIPIDETAFDKAKVNKFEKPHPYDDTFDNLEDRKFLQMTSDYEKYSNQNLNKDMSALFNGKHPAILAQKHGNSKEAKLARKFNGTIKSGL